MLRFLRQLNDNVTEIKIFATEVSTVRTRETGDAHLLWVTNRLTQAVLVWCPWNTVNIRIAANPEETTQIKPIILSHDSRCCVLVRERKTVLSVRHNPAIVVQLVALLNAVVIYVQTLAGFQHWGWYSRRESLLRFCGWPTRCHRPRSSTWCSCWKWNQFRNLGKDGLKNPSRNLQIPAIVEHGIFAPENNLVPQNNLKTLIYSFEDV